MPPFGPIKRKDLVGYFARLGFEGPYSGGRNQFMVKGDITPYESPIHIRPIIGRELLRRILHQAEISRDAWEKL